MNASKLHDLALGIASHVIAYQVGCSPEEVKRLYQEEGRTLGGFWYIAAQELVDKANDGLRRYRGNTPTPGRQGS